MNARPQHPRPQHRSEHCPQHGDLVAELALGRLSDADALRAERVLAGCESCRAWHSRLDHPEVAGGVAEGIAAFRVPAARPAAREPERTASRRWPLRAAAVLALAAGGAAAWMARDGLPEGGPDRAAVETPRAGETLLAEGLESGGPGELETTLGGPEVIFADGMESGDLGAWRSPS